MSADQPTLTGASGQQVSGGNGALGAAVTGPTAATAPASPPTFDGVAYRDPGPPPKPSRFTRANGTQKAKAPDQHKLTRAERKAMGKLRARKVRRVVRHVDPWSVLKLSLIFYFCLFIVSMVAGVILWNIASHAGTIDSIQNQIKDYGLFDTFSFEGDVIFRAASLIGLILVVTATGINVLLAVLFNLISDLVGGIRVTVIEEETARPVTAAR